MTLKTSLNQIFNCPFRQEILVGYFIRMYDKVFIVNPTPRIAMSVGLSFLSQNDATIMMTTTIFHMLPS